MATSSPYATITCVIGMHRSGTSALARALMLLGGEGPVGLLPPSEQNPRGFWESSAVNALNNRLLAAGDANWHSLPPLARQKGTAKKRAAEQAAHETIRDVVRQEYPAARNPVIKDPRLCRLSDLWIAALRPHAGRLLFPVILRSPIEVAASLTARNGFSRLLGLLLWTRYYLDAEFATRDATRGIVHYAELLGDWRAALASLAEQTGERFAPTKSAAAAIDAFLTAELHHMRADEEQTRAELAAYPMIGECHEVLMAWHARKTLSPSQQSSLDRIRADFDRIGTLVDTAVEEGRLAEKRLAQLKRETRGRESPAPPSHLPPDQSPDQPLPEPAESPRLQQIQMALQQVLAGLDQRERLAEDLTAARRDALREREAAEREREKAARERETAARTKAAAVRERDAAAREHQAAAEQFAAQMARYIAMVEAARQGEQELKAEIERGLHRQIALQGEEMAAIRHHLDDSLSAVAQLTAERDKSLRRIELAQAEAARIAAELRDLHAELAAVRERETAATALADTRAAHLASLASQHDRAMDALRREQERRSALHGQALAALEHERGRDTERLKALSQQAAELTERLDTARIELTLARQTLASTRAALASAEASGDHCRSELAALAQRHDEALARAAIEQGELSSRIATLAAAVGSLSASLAAAREERAEALAARAEHARAHQAALDEAEAHRAAADVADRRRLAAERAQSEAEYARSEAQRSGREAEQAREAVLAQWREAEEGHAARQAELKEVTRKYRSTQATLVRTKAGLDNAKARLEDAYRQLRDSEEQLRKLRGYRIVRFVEWLVAAWLRGKAAFALWRGSRRGAAADAAIVEQSGLFDAQWYLARYPDVAQEGIRALDHYLRHGWREGRDPGPDFSATRYLRDNADVAQAGVNPLVHYIQFGQAEGRGTRQSKLAAPPSPPPVASAQAAPVFQPAEPAPPAAARPTATEAPSFDELAEACAATPAAADALARFRALSGLPAATTDVDAWAEFANDMPDLPLDAWFIDGQTLRLRWDVGDGDDGDDEDSRAVRVFCQRGGAGEAVSILATMATVDALDVADVPLLSPYHPLFVATLTSRGRIDRAGLIAFPSLLRGGLHHADYLAAIARGDCSASCCPVAYGSILASRWAALRAGEAAPAVARIGVDVRGARGTGKLLDPQFRQWLADVFALPVEVHGEPETRAERILAEQVAMEGGTRAGSGTLVVQADMLPGIAILCATESGTGDPASAYAAPLAHGLPNGDEPGLAIALPPVPLGEPAASRVDAARHLPRMLGAPAPARPLPAAVLSSHRHRPLDEAELLFPLSAGMVLTDYRPATVRMVIEMAGVPPGDAVATLESLAMQDCAEAIAIAFLGEPPEEAAKSAQALFAGRVDCGEHWSDAVGPDDAALVGHIAGGTVLHDRRTLAVLAAHVSAGAASACCPVVTSERRGKGWGVKVVDNGLVTDPAEGPYLRAHAASSTTLWRTNYPVRGPVPALWLASAGKVRRWVADDRHRLDRVDGLHWCTATVTASISTSEHLPLPAFQPPLADPACFTSARAISG